METHMYYLRNHEGDEHIERGRLHVHGRGVTEVIVEILEGARGFVEVDDRIGETWLKNKGMNEWVKE